MIPKPTLGYDPTRVCECADCRLTRKLAEDIPIRLAWLDHARRVAGLLRDES
jgi:hypothetical protein